MSDQKLKSDNIVSHFREINDRGKLMQDQLAEIKEQLDMIRAIARTGQFDRTVEAVEQLKKRIDDLSAIILEEAHEKRKNAA